MNFEIIFVRHLGHARWRNLIQWIKRKLHKQKGKRRRKKCCNDKHCSTSCCLIYHACYTLMIYSNLRFIHNPITSSALFAQAFTLLHLLSFHGFITSCICIAFDMHYILSDLSSCYSVFLYALSWLNKIHSFHSFSRSFHTCFFFCSLIWRVTIGSFAEFLFSWMTDVNGKKL